MSPLESSVVHKATLFLLAGALLVACDDSGPRDWPIPAQSDWIDFGTVLVAGEVGAWDHILWGGFSASAIKRDDVYYLFYQGSSSYRFAPDQTVCGRAIGVATGLDGVNFTKYEHNPVVSWAPNRGCEEGAVSSAVAVDDDGEFVLYYGANTEETPSTVSANGRIATSADGFRFTDVGIALDRTDGTLWSAGDELFPVLALRDAGRWFVYYLPNGVPEKGTLGVAWGDAKDRLVNSSRVTDESSASIAAWGTAGSAKIEPGTYALFLNRIPQRQTDVRVLSLDAPAELSRPVESYRFEGATQATVLLDEERRTWFLYYRGEEGYGVKLAPAGEPDTTPPTVPTGLSAKRRGPRLVELEWDAATDSETGVAAYNVYRNGVRLDTVKGLDFSDAVHEHAGYSYEVSAINYHGTEGARSAPIEVLERGDRGPPPSD